MHSTARLVWRPVPSKYAYSPTQRGPIGGGTTHPHDRLADRGRLDVMDQSKQRPLTPFLLPSTTAGGKQEQEQQPWRARGLRS